MARTIYFSGSITGGRNDVDIYRRIVSGLEAAGHRVLAGSVISQSVGPTGEALAEETIFARDMGWLEEAARAGGVLVAEVSMPSTGVGYEIAAARYRFRMPVICLYRPAHTKRCSAMVSGDPEIEVIEYTVEALGEALARLLRAIE